jgi:DNA-binding MarR family transcriptional regulator
MRPTDTVDLVQQQWRRALPDLDTRALGVTHRITAIATSINRDAEAVFSPLGVTGATFDVLAALYAAGPDHQLSPSQLYKGRLVSSGGMTARLDLAEAAGLVARSRDQRDRRGVVVTLSDAGVRVVTAGVTALLDRERHLGAAVSVQAREAVTRLLAKLLRSGVESSSTADAAPDSAESLLSSWVGAFPNQNPWLVHLLGAIPLLSSKVDRESQKVLGALGLSPNAFGLLCALRRAGPPFRLTPTELYDLVVLSPAGVTGLLDKLERAGLIERSTHPEDKRLNRASLTKIGQKVVNHTIGDFVMHHEWLLKPLTETERDELTASLRQILVALPNLKKDQSHG